MLIHVVKRRAKFVHGVPAEWRHFGGPLHDLIALQRYRCAVCEGAFTWQSGSGMEPRQWVSGGLLQALACYGCSRRYAQPETKAPASKLIARNLRAIRKRPPGQQCPSTRGQGTQERPRPFRSDISVPEAPSSSWQYWHTICHSLLLWQRGRCAICSTGLQVQTQSKTVHVDHDPHTGLIRGILCNRCNIALGKNYGDAWWAHNLAFKNLYLKQPVAQQLPFTAGVRYAQRGTKATVVLSGDRRQTLCDGSRSRSSSRPLSLRCG